MIRNLKIAPRLLVLISVQGVVLLLAGAITLGVLKFANDTTTSLNDAVARGSKLTTLAESLRSDLINTVHATNVGSITWAEGRKRLARAKEDFEANWKIFLAGHSAGDREFLDDVLTPDVKGVRQAFTEIAPIFESQDRSRLSLFVSNDLEHLVSPFLNGLVASTVQQQLEAENEVASASQSAGRYATWSIFIVAAGLLVSFLLGFAIYRSISRPLGQIAGTIQEVSAGNFDARTYVVGPDELGTLGSAFDDMLNDRVATLSRAQEENEKLNNAVMALLQAVYQLSQRDLTVKVPVTEDVTGPIADSLNLMTGETAKVLQGVLEISHDVAQASNGVKQQSDTVITAATEEQAEVQRTAAELATASESMTRIAALAQACNEAADKAISSTIAAHETVSSTVSGITAIRDTIRETEKRIKRLGERSQEINRVVNIINTIAERTHILALNASMHAASAGEAGRGFAVVADEVQRLAESAHEATMEISGLVNNIQVETSDTVTTMNEAISQVVEGSQLAEQAGSQMQNTQASTSELVAMVQQIAEQSQQQALSSNELRARAEEIRKSSEDTNAQLREQTRYTDQLVSYSDRLLEAVSVFKLPASTAEARPGDTAVRALRDGAAVANA